MANQIIKSIAFTKEWKNPQGQVFYYHDIEFDNGDKGQIGAKSKLPEKLQVGKSLDYEKTTDAQGNVKIKALQLPNGVSRGMPPNPEKTALEIERLKLEIAIKKDSDHTQRMIVAQSCYAATCNLKQQSSVSHEDVLKMTKTAYDFIMNLSK